MQRKTAGLGIGVGCHKKSDWDFPEKQRASPTLKKYLYGERKAANFATTSATKEESAFMRRY